MSAVELTEQDIEASRVGIEIGPHDPDIIAGEVARRCGVTVRAMRGKSRLQHVVRAREQLYRALRTIGWSFPAIGEYVRRDHSTIVCALRPLIEKRAKYARHKQRVRAPKPHWLGPAGWYVESLLSVRVQS